ncbi:MAG TPA: poly-gamma-glutamate biosynthesis protein PgsC/CapC, partial [Noviherbaspirillum sp.]|nr:poly-gamma-glutamate biosynthesis protein PgsC/CapC [Noviherbaspirillum sp.]
MLSWFPLSIFPEGALSASVIVTVWVGITIVAITNLRLGWVLSGLVIPGYMVPLLIVKPWAAGVVFAEGVITYALVWLYSEYATRYTGLSSFFGRDRFFALVLASVAVRIVMDGLLLPELGNWLLQNYDTAFDYRSNLHSFGLIIVALIANNFWKTGVVRGAWPMFVQVGLTWLFVRYGLMEFTNFNMSSLAFMYEDSASSFLASPKSYIILLVTAFIASRLNLFYGWDFSGILIPSLLALQWYEPHKILTTFVEALVILVLADAVLRLPIFRTITMEGARKLLLFFNVSFVYKFVLSWVLVLVAPELKVSDWFGFGYLLATLIALKIHDKGILARMTRATLQTSLAGVAAATVIGFVLVLMPDPEWNRSARAAGGVEIPSGPVATDARSLEQVLEDEKTRFYASSFHTRFATPLQHELDAFAAGVRRLLEYRQTGDPAALESARRWLSAANYEVLRVAEHYLVLRERTLDAQQRRHWGTYVLSLDAGSRLLVSVPAPLDEAGTYEAALTLFGRFGAQAFASSATSRYAGDDGAADVLNRPQTVFQVFHRELAAPDILQVRSRAAPASVLHVSGPVPGSLRLPELEQSTGSLSVEFSPSTDRNLQRRTLRGNFSEFWLNHDDAHRMRPGGTGKPAPAME